MKDYNKLSDDVIETEDDKLVIDRLVTLKKQKLQAEKEVKFFTKEIETIVANPEKYVDVIKTHKAKNSQIVTCGSHDHSLNIGAHSHTIPYNTFLNN